MCLTADPSARSTRAGFFSGRSWHQFKEALDSEDGAVSGECVVGVHDNSVAEQIAAEEAEAAWAGFLGAGQRD
ncbi:MAG: hypothetical protein RLZZ436_3330 [Planctomycetota bacterium]